MNKICIFHNSDKEFLSKESFIKWIKNGFGEPHHQYIHRYIYCQPAFRPLSAGDKIIFAYGSKELKHTWLIGEANILSYKKLEGNERYQKTAETNKSQTYNVEYHLNPKTVVIYNAGIELTPSLIKTYLPKIWKTMQKVGHKNKAGYVFRIGVYVSSQEYQNIKSLLQSP